MQRQAFDQGYVRRLAQSDPETERDFVAYFGDLLAIKLRPRLRAADLIEDVIQETFLRVLKTLRSDSIGTPEALGSFVNSVCNNILFEVYRKQSRIAESAESAEDRLSDEIGVESALASEEDCAEVRQVLSGLPEKDRKILLLVFFEDRDKEEICRTLGVDREYLRVLVHRAKTRFRADWTKRSATKTARTSP